MLLSGGGLRARARAAPFPGTSAGESGRVGSSPGPRWRTRESLPLGLQLHPNIGESEMDKYVRAMNGPDHGRKMWTRSAGPMARLDWLEGGKLTEQVPDWFIDFFLESRDLGAIDFDS